MPVFILYLASANNFVKKKDRKRDAIVFNSSGCIEIVFALLTELIAI